MSLLKELTQQQKGVLGRYALLPLDYIWKGRLLNNSKEDYLPILVPYYYIKIEMLSHFQIAWQQNWLGRTT